MTEIRSTRVLVHHESTTVIVNPGDRMDEYQMSIPAPYNEDGGLTWRLIYGDKKPSRKDIMAAVSLLGSYRNLLSGEINQAEAFRRLKCLRAEYKKQSQ